MNSLFVAIIQLIIYLLIVLSMLSVDAIGGNACNVQTCSREYSQVFENPQKTEPNGSLSGESGREYCSLLMAYQHCLRSVSKTCRGNLEFHTLQTLLKNWKHEYNCSAHNSNHPFPKQTKVVPITGRRTGQSLVTQYNSWNQQNLQNMAQEKERLQSCLSAAYNYTINIDKSMTTSSTTGRTKHLSEFSTFVGHKQRIGRDVSSLRSGRPVKSLTFPIKGETIDSNEEMESIPSTVPTVRPSVPPSPPLTCIIYGDPHLRTLNNEYQTCKCLGAWPLIDHPLFTVQITNSKIKGSSPQVTGVTRVTVLVRQFTKCGIHSDLTYEADSQSNPGGQPSASPAATFIDGSTSNANNLIRITQSSNNNVITIHLDHIGVRVYIGQFQSSGYLNVVIKFRSATSTVKQQLVLNSIDSTSLCKTGCPKRELIDIRQILSASGVDPNADTVLQTDNDVNDYKPDPTVIDNNANEDTGNEPPEESADDPCGDLYGYYRISCLYDVTIKGIKDSNNANRFAQSFDERKFIENSILNDVKSVESSDSTVRSIANSSPNHCLNIFIVFVITLITRLLL